MRNISLGLLLITIFCLQLESCDEKKVTTEFNGGLVNHSECKSSKSALIMSDVPDSVSCVNYIFDADAKTIYLSHLNAGFNCCPESLYCNISMNADTIYIEEFEKSNACDCNCLFDLDYELSGIELKTYFIEFKEPYAANDEKLVFEIDLTGNLEGSYCVKRTHYPWAIKK